jgi:hypothetical protein
MSALGGGGGGGGGGGAADGTEKDGDAELPPDAVSDAVRQARVEEAASPAKQRLADTAAAAAEATALKAKLEERMTVHGAEVAALQKDLTAAKVARDAAAAEAKQVRARAPSAASPPPPPPPSRRAAIAVRAHSPSPPPRNRTALSLLLLPARSSPGASRRCGARSVSRRRRTRRSC